VDSWQAKWERLRGAIDTSNLSDREYLELLEIIDADVTAAIDGKREELGLSRGEYPEVIPSIDEIQSFISAGSKSRQRLKDARELAPHIRNKFLEEQLNAVRGNLGRTQATLRNVANDLRRKYGKGFIVEKLYKIATKKREDLIIIESIRNLGEIEILKDKGLFYLLVVEANPSIRYKRIVLRGGNTDKISFEKFMEDEKREMASVDPNKQNLSLCIENADFLFTNNKRRKDLYKQINDAMHKIIPPKMNSLKNF